MNKILSFAAIMAICLPVFGETSSNSRRTNAAQWNAATRAGTVASTSQIMGKAATGTSGTSAKNTTQNSREDEKNACIENNVGINNTFVWAAKNSDVTDYSSMIEDTENPENNTCFVRVELISTDSDIKMDNIPAVYQELNDQIICGEWADSKVVEKNILDGKKTARVWGTVAGSVGGAGVGVGSMELFGNRLIGGKVMGQKDLEKNDYDAWVRSELLELYKKDKSKFDEFKKNFTVLRNECNALKANGTKDENLPAACTQIDYERIFKNIPAV